MIAHRRPEKRRSRRPGPRAPRALAALTVLVLLGFGLAARADEPPPEPAPSPPAPTAPEETPAPTPAPPAEAPPPAKPAAPAAQAPTAEAPAKMAAGEAAETPPTRADAGRPVTWEPKIDGPPPPSFPPSSGPQPGRRAQTTPRHPTRPFAEEPDVTLEAFGTNDEASGGPGIVVPKEPPTRTEVAAIAKTHNVVWRCECPGKAIRLDLLFAVVGMKGEWVGASVDFYDAHGRPILSVLEPFMNRSGQVSAWTKLIRVEHDARWLRTTLLVPYGAFPCPIDKDDYAIEARVHLIRRRAPDQYQIVVSDSTTFTVFGKAAGPRDWHDYVGADRAPMQPCDERIRRMHQRSSPLDVIREAPRRAKEMWRPFCPVPGA